MYPGLNQCEIQTINCVYLRIKYVMVLEKTQGVNSFVNGKQVRDFYRVILCGNFAMT